MIVFLGIIAQADNISIDRASVRKVNGQKNHLSCVFAHVFENPWVE